MLNWKARILAKRAATAGMVLILSAALPDLIATEGGRTDNGNGSQV